MNSNTEQPVNEGAKGIEYTELGIPVTEHDGSKQSEYLHQVYEQMQNSAETNFFRRPGIQSFDNLGRKISWLAIPTLEDLKCALYEAGDQIVDLGPEKVFTMQDIETAAYMSDCAHQFRFVPNLASIMMDMVSNTIISFTNECTRSAGTTKIFDVDHREISVDGFFKKYFEGLQEAAI